MERTVISPKTVAPPAAHYSHGVVVSGPVLYVAGQVPLDQNGELVGRGDAAAQAEQVLTNLENIVEAAGGKLEQAARTTVYLTRLEDRGPVGAVRKRYFTEAPPANTLLVVSSLANPDFLVEIDAIVPLSELDL
jgi:reactive intermediate/imine deaminase